MKTHLKHLLGLALMVLVLAGCSNPAGPEIETPVVETPEDNAKLIKVEFRWCTYYNKFKNTDGVKTYAPMYLLDLHYESDLKSYAYGFPEGYNLDSYSKLLNDEEHFNEFSKDAFEKVFGTKYYKEGAEINLEKWTSKAIRLDSKNEDSGFRDCLCFSSEDIDSLESFEVKKFFDEIIVNNEDIVVYVFFDFGKQNLKKSS